MLCRTTHYLTKPRRRPRMFVGKGVGVQCCLSVRFAASPGGHPIACKTARTMSGMAVASILLVLKSG